MSSACLDISTRMVDKRMVNKRAGFYLSHFTSCMLVY